MKRFYLTVAISIAVLMSLAVVGVVLAQDCNYTDDLESDGSWYSEVEPNVSWSETFNNSATNYTGGFLVLAPTGVGSANAAKAIYHLPYTVGLTETITISYRGYNYRLWGSEAAYLNVYQVCGEDWELEYSDSWNSGGWSGLKQGNFSFAANCSSPAIGFERYSTYVARSFAVQSITINDVEECVYPGTCHTVDNNNFETTDSWTLNATAEISGGALYLDSDSINPGMAYQAITTTALATNTTYSAVITVSQVTYGPVDLQVRLNDSYEDLEISSPGTYTATLYTTDETNYLYVLRNVTPQGSGIATIAITSTCIYDAGYPTPGTSCDTLADWHFDESDDWTLPNVTTVITNSIAILDVGDIVVQNADLDQNANYTIVFSVTSVAVSGVGPDRKSTRLNSSHT